MINPHQLLPDQLLNQSIRQWTIQMNWIHSPKTALGLHGGESGFSQGFVKTVGSFYFWRLNLRARSAKPFTAWGTSVRGQLKWTCVADIHRLTYTGSHTVSETNWPAQCFVNHEIQWLWEQLWTFPNATCCTKTYNRPTCTCILKVHCHVHAL